MEASYPAVHPVGVPPQFKGAGPPATRMKDLPGSAGTLGGMGIRFGQFAFALTSFCVMITIPDFSSVTAFCFLVAAMVFQCMWSLSMGILDGYAILSGQCLHNSLFVSLFVVGDWVTSTITFSGACATAGITVLIDTDLNRCGPNHCSRLEAAVAMAFLSWIMISLSFFFSFWLLSSSFFQGECIVEETLEKLQFPAVSVFRKITAASARTASCNVFLFIMLILWFIIAASSSTV